MRNLINPKSKSKIQIVKMMLNTKTRLLKHLSIILEKPSRKVSHRTITTRELNTNLKKIKIKLNSH